MPAAPTRFHLGDVVSKVMKDKTLNQKQLAKKARVSPMTVSALLRQKTKTDPATLERVAEALEMSPAEIWARLARLNAAPMTDTEQPPPPPRAPEDDPVAREIAYRYSRLIPMARMVIQSLITVFEEVGAKTPPSAPHNG